MQTPSVENIFVRSWQLLRRNWIIIVPGLVAGLIAGFVHGVAAATGSPDGGIAAKAAAGIAGIIATIIGIVASIATIAYTTGMAGAAWQRGTTVLSDGYAAFVEDAGRVFGAMVLLFVIAAVLAVVTLGIGAVIFGFFAIYTLPAVVLSNAGPIAALKESFRIASQRWVTTLLILLMLFFVGVVAIVVSIPFAIIPLLGPMIFAIVTQAVAGFATLAIVGEYLSVRAASPGPLPESRI